MLKELEVYIPKRSAEEQAEEQAGKDEEDPQTEAHAIATPDEDK